MGRAAMAAAGVPGDPAHRLVEADPHMALCGQVIDFVGLQAIQQLDQVPRIADIPIVQEQPPVLFVGILVEVVDATRVEAAGPPDGAVYLVALLDEKFREQLKALGYAP